MRLEAIGHLWQEAFKGPGLLSWLAVFTQHPAIGLNLPQPILDRGNPAEVFQNVLLTDESHWDHTAGRERDRGAKQLFEHEDARRMMPEGPVPEVSHVLLAGVEPLVQVQILPGFAAEFLG